MDTVGQYSVHIIRSTVLAYAFRFRKSGLITQNSQCTYKRNTEARSRNHCCGGKATSITKSVFVALVIQHAMRMRLTVICGLPGFYSIFPHYLINCMIFEEKKVTEYELCVLLHGHTLLQ